VASRHGNDGEQQQHTVINNFVSRHGSGTVRSVGRDWWLRWFGVLDTPAARVFEELLPCHAIIMTTTGLPAKVEGKFTTPCGLQRYCRNCEKVFDVLDMSYPADVLADVTMALITKCVPTWIGKNANSSCEWARKDHPDREHICDNTCSMSA
jgi:hypothetical protein